MTNIKHDQQLNDQLNTIITTNQLPGATIAIYKDQTTRYACAGYVDESKQTPYDTDIILRVGCLSKVFIATQVMILKDQDSLDLDAPIARYLPTLQDNPSDKLNTITTKQLMTHTSGLVSNFFVQGEPLTTTDLMDKVTNLEESQLFVADPGQYCSYSSLGYIFLCCVVESISKQPWQQHLNEALFVPLGIDCKQMAQDPEQRTFAPTGRILNADIVGPHLHRKLVDIMPADGGSLALTAQDLLIFARMHLDKGVCANGERVLSAQSVEQMQSEFEIPSGPWGGMKGLSFGWLAYDDHSYGFTGDGTRNHVLLRILPEHNIATVALANYHSASMLFADVWQLAVGELKLEKRPPNLVDVKTEFELEALCGTYYDGTQNFEVRLQDELTVYVHNEACVKYIGENIVAPMSHIEENHYIAPALGNFCNLWFMDLQGNGQCDYAWIGVALLKKIA
jgi:CubicO group peptidase (beta-lactamase class C family)